VSEFVLFVRVGFQHITDLAAIDHLLFLVALVAPYRPKDWRHLLGVASAFTVGHSLTLALVATGTIGLPTSLIEFLIPVTIVAAALENLRGAGQRPRGWGRPVLAAGFGLIHGAGFAGFLGEMFSGDISLPLFAFNVGIELGQVAILILGLAILAGVDRLVATRAPSTDIAPRRIATSLLAAGWAALMAVQRVPW
jgi:hypothetical protein